MFAALMRDHAAKGAHLRLQALQVLQRAKPQLACQLTRENLRALSLGRMKDALLVLHQLLVVDSVGLSDIPAAVSKAHSMIQQHFKAQERLSSQAQLWQQLAAGEVGRLPIFLAMWQGPPSIKDYLQVGALLLAACSVLPASLAGRAISPDSNPALARLQRWHAWLARRRVRPLPSGSG
jgi:hypothetical protein